VVFFLPVQVAETEQRRLQVECEGLRSSVDGYRDSESQFLAEILGLTDQRKSLHSEVTSLSGEVRLAGVRRPGGMS
jgi:hypothetical protein